MNIEDFKVGEYYLYHDKLPPQMMAIDICIIHNNKLAIKQIKNIIGCDYCDNDIYYIEYLIKDEDTDDVYRPLTQIEKVKYL